MITHLFFDAGNTIVFVNMDAVAAALARRGVRVTAADLWRAEHAIRPVIDDPDLIRRSDDAARWRFYFDRILDAAGVGARGRAVDAAMRELKAYHDLHNLWESVPPEVPLALDLLRRRYRLAVISNANGTVREKLRRVGLLPYFDIVLDSHEERMEKPDPRLFRAAMARTGARPEGSLHVGDFYHIDVAGARAAGMHALLVDPAGAHDDKPVSRIPGVHRLLSFLAAPVDGAIRRHL